MKSCNLKTDVTKDTVRLRPEDIAILVFATERLIRMPGSVAMPRDCAIAIKNVAAGRIQDLIRALEESQISETENELLFSMRVGDQKFFSDVIYDYYPDARANLYVGSQDSEEEIKEQLEKLNARFSDIYYRLGGDSWDHDIKRKARKCFDDIYGKKSEVKS